MRLALLAAALFGLSLLVGAAGLGVPDAAILWQIRLPRAALALLVGAGLGLSGAVLQGALRNPAAADGQQGRLFIGFAAAELLGLIAFAVAMIILYAV